MLIADVALATRLEALVADEIERFTALAVDLFPGSRARTLRVGEGIASFGGDEIPFSEVVGLGVTRPVTAAELDTLEAFYDDCGGKAEALLCTVGDAAFATQLAFRGWLPAGYEDVLVAPLDKLPAARTDASSLAGVDLRVVEPHEHEQWGRCVAVGFSDTGEPAESELRFGRIIASRANSVMVWAWADGLPVATGELQICDGVGWLAADTTLPQYRGRGIQQALQRMRLEMARDAGCDIAVSEATPGSTSHRNQQRQGFRLAYTHVAMERAARDTSRTART